MSKSEKCPTCDSPAPHLHPALQHEGEVQLCRDPWHRPAPLTQERVMGIAEQWAGRKAVIGVYDIFHAINQALSESSPGMVSVPRALADALRAWSGAEPSQSVLAREVDRWIAASERSEG